MAMEVNGPVVSTVEFKQEIIDKIGFVPVSSSETSRFLRGTYLDEAEAVMEQGYGIERLSGFSDNAVPLSNSEDDVVDSIQNTHRGAPVAVIFTFPNVRPAAMHLADKEKLPRPFRTEILFTKVGTDPSLVRSSGVTWNPDAVIDPQFIEGFYDKEAKEWHPNPNYWENRLIEQGKQEGWSQEEYEVHHQEQKTLLREQAINKLDEEVIIYQQQRESEQRDFDAYYQEINDASKKDEIENNEEIPIVIP